MYVVESGKTTLDVWQDAILLEEMYKKVVNCHKKSSDRNQSEAEEPTSLQTSFGSTPLRLLHHGRHPVRDAPDSEQRLTIDQVRAMSDTERDQIRQDRMMEHIEDLAESHKVEEDMAIATTYHMSPEDFKERMDEMLWFLRLRSTLTELDRLLEIAMDLEKHLKGDITETYPTYLETLTDDTLDRLVNATNNLSRTARSTRFHRKLQLAGQYTNVGATENRVRAICDLQINRLVKNMPDDPKEWIDLDSEQFEFVWEKVEALQQAVQGWKPDSDQELQTLRDELSSIWKIAANFDRDELIQYGLQGV